MDYNFDELIDRRGTRSYKWDSAPGDDVIPMWVADMDFRTAPAITEALMRRVRHGIFGYVKVPEEYYSALTSWFSRRHGWRIGRDWIQYTSGVVPAVSVVVKALCRPGDKVILQTPVYNCFFSSVRNNGCEILENPLRNDGGRFTMDYDDLEAKAADPRARLLVLCNPHNPAGRVWTAAELERLNNICLRHGVRVLSDEIHCELTRPGLSYTPFAAVSADCLKNAVVANSPSKAFNTAGLQIANIICSDAATRAAIDRAININEVCDVNPFGVEGLIAAYNGGEEWLDALRRYLWGNYTELCRFFAERLPALKVTPLEGTYLVWVDCRRLGLSSDELAARLAAEGRVMVNSGTMYGLAGEGFVRINIACPRSRMMEGLRRLASVLERVGA